MKNDYSITITDGVGKENILNGTYNVSATSNGYDSNTVDPNSITVDDSTDTFNVTIGATGSLTIHVSETGESSGTAIVGATFIRTDADGTQYGDVFTTDTTGNLTIPYLPFGTNTQTVYYKQTASDGNHNFNGETQSINLDSVTTTIEIANYVASEKTFNFTDANYEGLLLNGTITLN